MVKALQLQQTFSGGEADPELQERRDAEFYYQSVSRARNVQAQVQGGLTHCGGTWLDGAIRNPLELIAPADYTASAPNGGTAAHLVDGDADTVFQSNTASGSNFVVLQVVLDTDGPVDAIDLLGFFADNAADQVLAVRAQRNAGAWVEWGTVDVRTAARTRRFAVPPQGAVTIDTIQLIVETAGCGKVSVGGIRLWREAADTGGATMIPFAFSLEQQYTLVATAQNIDVFGNEADGSPWLAAIAAPVTEAMLERLNWSQRLDALTLYHEDLETQLIERQSLETEWNIRPYPFEHVPQYPFPDTDYASPMAGTPSHPIGSGGTAANLNDGNSATISSVTVPNLTGAGNASRIVARIDLGAEYDLTQIRALGVKKANNDTNNSYLGYSLDNTTWTQLGDVFAIDATARDYYAQGLFRARYVGLVASANNWPTSSWNPLVIGELQALRSGIDAVQEIRLFDSDVGENFSLIVEGQTTPAIELAASTAPVIKAALESLPNVDEGVVVSFRGSATYRVRFTGGRNGGRPWQLMTFVSGDEDLQGVVTDHTRGRPPGEAIMSASRGWPRAGAVSQQRHVLAGFKSLPLHMAASITGDPFDFDSELAVASGGFVWQLDADAADGVVDMVAARNLIVFTQNEAYYNAERVLDATATPDFRKVDQMGVEAGVPIAPIEGGLLFIERGGHVLRQMRYTDDQQSYATGALSTLSGHLLADPVDLARRRPVAGDRGDLVHIVNADGSVILTTVQAAEDVIGFTLAEYEGQRLAVACDENGAIRYVVRRTLGGVTRNWLERHDRALWLECASRVIGSDITTGTGFDAYEDDTVRVLSARDGGGRADEGLQDVDGGEVTVADAADEIVIGFDLFADIVDMPVVKDKDANRILARQKRVHTVKLALYETTSCAISVNGGPVIDLPLDEISLATFGTSIADRPYSGTIQLEGFLGFTKNGQVRVTQVRPGALTVQSITKEMVL